MLGEVEAPRRHPGRSRTRTSRTRTILLAGLRLITPSLSRKIAPVIVPRRRRRLRRSRPRRDPAGCATPGSVGCPMTGRARRSPRAAPARPPCSPVIATVIRPLAGRPQALHHVLRVAAGGQPDRDIAGLAERLDLSREDDIERVVVADRRQRATCRRSARWPAGAAGPRKKCRSARPRCAGRRRRFRRSRTATACCPSGPL